jgi:hypothetical protein
MESNEEPLDVELLRAEVKKTKNELMHVSMELRNLEVESHQAQLRESAKDKTIESLRKEIDELNYYNQRGNASYHSLKEKHTDISLICEEQRLQLQTLSLSLADLSERNSTLKEEVEFERTSHERAVNEFNWYSQKAVEAHQQLRALLLEWDATWPSSLKMRLTEAIESDAKADARLHHARFEKVEAKNALENYAYSVRNTVRDEKMKDKLSEEERKSVEVKVEEVTLWLEANETPDKEASEAKQKELEAICNPIFTKIYRGAEGGLPGAMPGGMP